MIKKYLFLPVILTFLSFLYSEEIGTLFYNGDIGELKDSTITVPDEAVAVSAEIMVDLLMDTGVVVGGPPSLFFIIDHSGSMYSTPGNDIWGKRFTVSLEFIDSIKAKFPNVEVSIAVFREHLYFDSADDNRFVQCPGYSMGAYLPFLKLDSIYAPSGETGYQIVKHYLQIDTVGDTLPLYVDLEYIPTNVGLNSASTNINVAFAAAKHAFQSALYAKERQFIIFLSDGEATVYNGPDSSTTEFVTDVDGLPATFTIFFTQIGQVPQNLVIMTDNIQANGYSTNNPRSNLWAIDVANLMDVLMDYVMKILIDDSILGDPDSITINGSMADNYDSINQSFSFDSYFSLTGVTTDFVYKITYLVPKDSVLPNGDTIVVQGDSTAEGSFDVVVNPSVSDPPDWYLHDFKLNCWDRTLGFYFNNNLVASINGGMDTLEIRFTETKVDTLYHYENVSVSITNFEGANKDIEFFNLTKTDSCFTKLFPLVLDSTPTPDDGVFQIYEEDIIIVKFRNPDLPLDTLWLLVPFNPTTAINPDSYSNQKILSLNIINSSLLLHLPTSGNTKLQIYNMKGRLLSTLVDSYKQAGSYRVNWDSERFGSGVYYIKLSTGNNTLIRKSVVIK